jgi:hypothetical protein
MSIFFARHVELFSSLGGFQKISTLLKTTTDKDDFRRAVFLISGVRF